MEPGSLGRGIERLCHDLGLPLPGPFDQDWAWQLPDEFRTWDFFMRYAKAYFASDYGDAERLPLMDVMLDVANDFATADEALGRRAWNVVADILRATRELHRRQLDDWCAFDDPLEDCFAISPHTRALYAELFGSRA